MTIDDNIDEFTEKYIASGRRDRVHELVNRKVLQYIENDFENIIKNGSVPSQLDTIKVKRSAYEKALEYSKRVVNLGKDNYISNSLELAFFMTGEKGSEIVDDFYIPGQEVSPTLCYITAGIEATMQIRREQKKDIIGWSHSHGSMTSFHSDLDDYTLTVLVKQKGRAVRVNMDESGYTDFSKEVRYFPSLVVNANGTEPYAAVGISYNLLSGKHYLKKKAKIEIVEDVAVDDIQSMLPSVETIDNELMERVDVRGKGNLGDLVRQFNRNNDTVIPSIDKQKDVKQDYFSLYSSLIDEYSSLQKKFDELKNRYLSLEKRLGVAYTE